MGTTSGAPSDLKADRLTRKPTKPWGFGRVGTTIGQDLGEAVDDSNLNGGGNHGHPFTPEAVTPWTN